MRSKISSLPLEIRNQLNHRLANGQHGKILLPWLNSLPEVQAALQQLDGKPITKQNLSEYRKHAYRHWELRQAALEFATDEVADHSASTQDLSSPLLDNLVHWSATRLAASAQTAPIPADVEAERRELRAFICDIVALRRGDLVARRLALEQQRLALDQAKDQKELEALFWKWTKRPDIQAKLFPHRDPDKARRDAIRLLDEHLLGVRPANNYPQPDPDAACLI